MERQEEQLMSDQSKLSRNTTSRQEEEDLGAGCSSPRAWTRMLRDEDGHRTTPW